MPKKNREKSKKGKKTELWKRYKDGKLVGKLCPKCKSFLADHKTRFYCGKCGYTETVSGQQPQAVKAQPANTPAAKAKK